MLLILLPLETMVNFMSSTLFMLDPFHSGRRVCGCDEGFHMLMERLLLSNLLNVFLVNFF